jgi:hypothetical protein
MIENDARANFAWYRDTRSRYTVSSSLVLAVTDEDNGYRAKVTFTQNVLVFVVSESITILRP